MTAGTHPVLPERGSLWQIAQAMGVGLTLVLIPALIFAPEPTLSLLWNLVIPILPATFLVNPILWRGVCPLATINSFSNGWFGRRQLKGKPLAVAGGVGIALLVLMVPARRFLFNVDGPALALTIVAVALLALILGSVYDVRAGFCSSICPVLPVERLYGQSPLMHIDNPRCNPCTSCVKTSCMDLSPAKSVMQVVGSSRQTHAWLETPFGLFAAGFPGFVLGYFLTADGVLADALGVYLTIGMWVLASYVSTVAIVYRFDVSFARMSPFLGAAAVGLYYWFASQSIADTLGAGGGVVQSLRVLAGTLVLTWLWRATHRTQGRVQSAAFLPPSTRSTTRRRNSAG
ncbi:MAG: hypothetical protein JRH19_28070 [Deltaproteobacteria bacterium]|nr:hypothetical protein [Deltaproteobacteria bacterium]